MKTKKLIKNYFLALIGSLFLILLLANCMLLFGVDYTFINNSSEDILVQPDYYTSSWSSFILEIGETEIVRVGLTEAFSFQHQGLYSASYIPYSESGNTITFY